ncbi:HPF/RaiA family ribosome-associated protein [Phytohalomonas tamaricis]|uniref:HPF/RaiA family ribosome-associated protein n=1 Tax=Phytohalomonas tamaricis TaxID=2081032 RepID=UPI000D0ABA09|nr:HPF/RaiA family ribosome-associated protein [Phytohalomonas tamaricis]
MQIPLEINYNGVSRSEWIDEYIRTRVDKLEHFCNDIIGCRVVVEQTQNNNRTGNPYRVLVEVTLPAKGELVADKEERLTDPQVQLRPLIRQACEAMEKQLKKHVAKRNNDVKHHDEPTSPTVAIVARTFAEEGYGFLKDASGEDVYFHRNSVLHDDFDRLTAGTQVRFEPEEGDKGLQASTVQIIDKPGVGGTDADEGLEMPKGWESN